jgi:uncharacterized OsmC-like protein
MQDKTESPTATPPINGIEVKKLFDTIEAVKAVPGVAKFKFRIRNEWMDAGHNRSTVNEFYGAQQDLNRTMPFILDADEPPLLLGKDLGANPVEYLLHALAACVTTSMVYHAAAKGIEIQEVESSVEGDIDLHGFLGLDKSIRNGYQQIRMNFRIKTDAPDERFKELSELGPTFSPVFDSITKGVPVIVKAERV